jgi:hypothetical protein
MYELHEYQEKKVRKRQKAYLRNNDCTWEADIRRIMVCGQSEQKNYQDPTSTNELGMLLHTCNSNYTGSIAKRVTIQG